MEASSPATLCKLLDALDSAVVESWRFEEADGRSSTALRNGTGEAPRLLLLVAHGDWQRALGKARSVYGDLPIVATSSSEQDEAAALDAGADVFCHLPLDWQVFDARVRALLRRQAPRLGSSPPGGGPALQLDSAARVLHANGTSIALSPREYDLIWALYQRCEQWVPRQSLLRAMSIKRSDSSLLRMHVLNIRNKLGSKHWMLQSERARGFLLTGNPERCAHGPRGVCQSPSTRCRP